jgi:hypothetical protein
VVLASAVMAGLAALALFGVERLGLPGAVERVLAVAAPGLAGLLAYFWLAERLGVGEVRMLLGLVRRRLGQ